MAGLGLHIQVLSGACLRHDVGGFCGVFFVPLGGGCSPSGARSRRRPQEGANHHHHHGGLIAVFFGFIFSLWHLFVRAPYTQAKHARTHTPNFRFPSGANQRDEAQPARFDSCNHPPRAREPKLAPGQGRRAGKNGFPFFQTLDNGPFFTFHASTNVW